MLPTTEMRMRFQQAQEESTTRVAHDDWAPRRILVAFDGSDGAWAALGRAIDIAQREHALLTIAAVVPEPSPWIGMGLVSVPYSREGLRRDAQRAMEQALAAARDEVPATVSVTTRLLSGRPSRALGELIEAGDFDLVVTGPRPARRLRRSVTRSVLAHSPASVLAVRPTVRPT
jgi:nucleotide-binding universal stress UspA family protein